MVCVLSLPTCAIPAQDVCYCQDWWCKIIFLRNEQTEKWMGRTCTLTFMFGSCRVMRGIRSTSCHVSYGNLVPNMERAVGMAFLSHFCSVLRPDFLEKTQALRMNRSLISFQLQTWLLLSVEREMYLSFSFSSVFYFSLMQVLFFFFFNL